MDTLKSNRSSGRIFERATLLILLLTAGVSLAQQPQHPIEPGAKLFVAPMDGNLDSFIVAELQKQKSPFTIVLKEEDAQYLLTGVSQKASGEWVWNANKLEASVRIVAAAGQAVVWSGEAGGLGGQRKIAEHIVKQMKKDLFPSQKK